MSPRERTAPRLVGAYRGCALMVLNGLLTLLLINLAAALLLALLPQRSGSQLYRDEVLAQAYPGWSEDDRRQLLDETWNRTYRYEPYVQFREQAFSGRFVNVSSAGFRQGPEDPDWPPREGEESVFVFGGSTAFGYGVADHETLPAALGRHLEATCGRPLPVYNLARSNYYSTQERILFTQLLSAGQVPRAAVFLDGLNDTLYDRDEPKFTGRLAALMDESDTSVRRRAVKTLALFRLLRRLQPTGPDAVTAGDPGRAPQVLERWRRNRQLTTATAEAAGAHALFVWQPVPAWGYDLEHHLFADTGIPAAELLARVYQRMDRERDPEDPQFLWLADVQEGRQDLFYIDRVHYSAAFNAELAGHIAERLSPVLCPP
ncbi:MAG: hypothetical protein AAF604_05760 [Acidobacteriota bacterium]